VPADGNVRIGCPGDVMKVFAASGIVAAAAILVGLISPVRAAPTTVGTATVVVRTVTGTLGTYTRRLILRDQVAQNEVIATEPDAASEILFEDGTIMTLGPHAVVKLDKFVYDPDPTRCAFFLTVVEGVFRFVTGDLPHQSYQITTPNGTIGIRG
jgi:hypothetical protein